MNATTDTAGHPDVAEISDLSEGLLPPSRSTDLRRHLDGCELCADVYASLEEIRGLLGTLPGPARMPADVAGRIDAALAAEALLASTATDGSPAAADADAEPGGTAQPAAAATEPPNAVGPPTATEPTSSVTDAPPARASAPSAPSSTRDGGHVSRETPAPADRPAGRPRATTGPGRKDRRSGRRRFAVLGAAFTVAALGLGSVLLSSWGGGSPSSSPGQEEQASSLDTFAAGTLERKVDDLLAANAKESASGDARTPRSLGVDGGPSSEGPRVLQQPSVPDCVRQGIGRPDPALATEQGVYEGRDALLVVLPDANDNSRVTVYVVDSGCVAQDSAAKAEVLLKDSYARP
ncbi:hypothetical protein ABZZ79_14445 [Streptomyces sp. NPDC006458]|uniref:hypothetical protein n=1 Tax=Streptomyces sp. NPDC006458 TaxID=3154302 RepID=UPI0033B3F01E